MKTRRSDRCVGYVGFFVLLVVFALGLKLISAEWYSGSAKHTVFSRILQENRDYLVSYPLSFPGKGKAYPLMIVLDGEDYFDWVSGMVRYYHNVGRVPEMLVVGVRSLNRWRDFTPTRANIPDGTAVPDSGGGQKFISFLLDELIPDLEKKVPLTPYRIIFGHSLAGLISVQALLDEDAAFSAAIATSPSLWWDNEVLLRKLDEKKSPVGRKKLFLAVGNEGPTMSTPIDHFSQKLRERYGEHLEQAFHCLPEASHQTLPFHVMASALESVFDFWPQKEGVTDRGLKAVSAHYRSVSQWMKEEVAVPERILNQLGYRLLKNGQLAQALEAFRLNVQLYPESANVHDSLGEGLLAAGRKKEALVQFRKALSLDDTLDNPKRMIQKIQGDS